MPAYPNIDSHESGALASNHNANIWETLPAAGDSLVTDPFHAGTYDLDGDGQTNGSEWMALTNALIPNSPFRLTDARIGAGLEITFLTVPGRTCQVQSSPNLAGLCTNVGTPSRAPVPTWPCPWQ